MLSPDQLNTRLCEIATAHGLEPDFAISQIATEGTCFLRRALTFLLADGWLSDQAEATFRQYLEAFRLSSDQVSDLVAEVAHYSFLRELHRGNLPRVQCSAWLPTTEVAHMEVQASYYRQLTNGYKIHPGRLILSNHRIIFTQTDKPFEVGLGKVIGVQLVAPQRIVLQLTRQKGTGFYDSAQALYFVEVAKAALDIFHRRLLVQQSGTRVIPQNIKAAVYQRDGGRCAQCGSSGYLEFDHVIPFALGGATSEGNLQLLCRRCNLAKGSKL
jgi:hypothetical protein